MDRRRERGLTLVELMVVITFLAVVIGISVWVFNPAAGEAKASATGLLSQADQFKKAYVLYYAEKGVAPGATYTDAVNNLISGNYLSQPPQYPKAAFTDGNPANKASIDDTLVTGRTHLVISSVKKDVCDQFNEIINGSPNSVNPSATTLNGCQDQGGGNYRVFLLLR